MAAQSGKLFQGMLCEGRSQPVETTDPVAAKAIDELKKQVARQRAEIEAERTKMRELQRDHEKEKRAVREEAEQKLEKSLEALSHRKDSEKMSEILQLKERLLKQNQQELRVQRTDLEEEMRKLERKLTREREETMRQVLNLERKKTEEELSHYLPEETVMTREEHLKAEIYRLGEEVERLEFQVSNLRRESRDQINIVRRMKQEHKIEVENLMRKNQVEAARDIAQLKLAEQIIQEKERHIHEEEYRVDMVLMEKEALAEELLHTRSQKALEGVSSREDSVLSPTSGKRVSLGHGGVLQRRVEELEGTVRKLDEERRQLKQENASLRKQAVKEGGGEGEAKGAEEKLKRLRKRNAELVALARQLDDKMKSLKAENEQLQKQSLGGSGGGGGGVSVGGGGGGGGKGGESEQQAKRALSRQHAKDISDYTKQLLSKDRELEGLRKRLAKYEVDGKPRYEPAPELESRLRAMAMERLKVEKVMVQLYSKVQDPLDVGKVTKKEMEGVSREMERLMDDNKSLREELELMKSQARLEDVDHSTPAESPRLQKQRSLPALAQAGKGKGSERGKEADLVAENAKLQARVTALEKCESEVSQLQTSIRKVKAEKSSLEQQTKRLTQQLKDTQQLAQEMDAVQEQCVELEKEVTEVRGQLNSRDTQIKELELEYRSATESLTDSRQEADSLRVKVQELEAELKEKLQEVRQLAAELEKQMASRQTPQRTDIGLQANLPPPSPEKTAAEPRSVAIPGRHHHGYRPASAGERRVKSERRSSRERVKSPVKGQRTSHPGVGEADASLDNEMRLAGYEITDPYDSSEGVAFSDTNLDSSLISLEDEGGSKGGDSVQSLGGGRSEPRPLEQVEEEPEEEMKRAPAEGEDGGQGKASEGERPAANEGIREEVPSVVEGAGLEVVVDPAGQGRGVVYGGGEEVVPAALSSSQQEVPGGRREVEGELEKVEKLFTHVETRGMERGGGVGMVGGGEEREGEGGKGERVVDLEALAEEDSGEEGEGVSTSSSEGDLPAWKNKGKKAHQAPPPEAAPTNSLPLAEGVVSVFIAKYSYVPANMSPNPNYDQELSLTAGDYLYVYGDMDEDGFFFAQLMNGESGLVPSNFVERVMEEGDHRRRRISELQDIAEVDENVSSGSFVGAAGVPPPCDLELERQFVEGDKYSVVIQWSPPSSLPSGTPVTNYRVYVNGQYKESVQGSGKMSAHLRDIPRQQLVKISVRTVTEEGESSDPQKMVVLNPQYPEPPTNVQVSLIEDPPNSKIILVQWTPSHPLEGGSQISGYVLLLNNQTCVKLQANSTPTDKVCAQLLPSDLHSLKLDHQEKLVLTVRALSDHYQSVDSASVVVSREMLAAVLQGFGKGAMLGNCDLESSHDSMVSSEAEEREVFSPAHRASTPPSTLRREEPPPLRDHVTQGVGHVTETGGQVTTEVGVAEPDGQVEQPQVNGPPVSAERGYMESNGVLEEEEREKRQDRGNGGLKYYVALFSYNPTFHSPNEEIAEDELAFREGDIIIGCSETDEEGFFEGQLRGKRGLVPSNMVELITDPEKLEQMSQLLADQQSRSPDPLSQLQAVNGGEEGSEVPRKMRVLYPYNPATDSPNDNPAEELALEVGDVITVFGWPDEDGYYQGELNGKRGLVPSNFLEEVGEGGRGGEAGEQVVGMEVFAASEDAMEDAKRIIEEASNSLKRSGSAGSSDDAKHKKGILSKGKNLFSKGSKGLGKK